MNARYKLGGRRIVLIDVELLPNGGLKGYANGTIGRTTYIDQVVTLTADQVKKLRVRLYQ